MAERNYVVEQLGLEYEGLFDLAGLYEIIDDYFKKQGYEKTELENSEYITENGKQITLIIEPYKKISDYAKLMIRIKIIFSDIKEVQVEKDGEKFDVNNGNVSMVFDGYLETDYEGRLEQKPIYFFMRTIFDKFIYKIYTKKFENEVSEDVKHLHDNIKAFLNLQKY